MFKRENRYFVFKRSDLDKQQLRVLSNWNKTVQLQRLQKGKDTLTALVIESDWPEYEPTWDAIQRRIEAQEEGE